AGAMRQGRGGGGGGGRALPAAAHLYVPGGRGEAGLAGETLGPGDSARITGAEGLAAVGVTPAELLVWEMGP
ncbi:pirin family protein, partial [Streptomyces griseoluteus]